MTGMTPAQDIDPDQTVRASRPLWSRDFDTVLTSLALPYRITTRDCDTQHRTEADLRQAPAHDRQHLDDFGAQASI